MDEINWVTKEKYELENEHEFLSKAQFENLWII